MRFTLTVLSILRVLPVTRVSFIIVLAASFLAAGSARVHAVEVREHKKTVPVARPHKKPVGKRAAVSASRHKSHVAAGASRRRATTQRASTHGPSTYRASTHNVSSRKRSRRGSSGTVRVAARSHSRRVYHFSSRTRSNRPHVEEVAARPHSSPVESADLSESHAATPQQAADSIAARASHSHIVGADAAEASAASVYGGKIVAMAPLRGSLQSLVRQNQRTDADNLERILNDSDLHERIAQGVLVPVPASSALAVNADLPADRRYCRPWTAAFLADFSKAHDAEFHHPLEVSSAVRTVEYQKRLMRTNGNAAPAEGDVASPHLTGATIDIAKSGLSRRELYWMRNRLNTLQSQGKIDVEEEFHQSCFHITVYKSYTGAGAPHKPQHHLAEPPADDSDDSDTSAAAVGSR